MHLDLLLQLDDDLHADLVQVAALRGGAIEEVVCERLLMGSGCLTSRLDQMQIA